MDVNVKENINTLLSPVRRLEGKQSEFNDSTTLYWHINVIAAGEMNESLPMWSPSSWGSSSTCKTNTTYILSSFQATQETCNPKELSWDPQIALRSVAASEDWVMWLTSTSFTTLWWSSFFRMAISLYTFSRGNVALGNRSCCDPWGGGRPEITHKHKKTYDHRRHRNNKNSFRHSNVFHQLTEKSTLLHQLLLWNDFHRLSRWTQRWSRHVHIQIVG